MTPPPPDNQREERGTSTAVVDRSATATRELSKSVEELLQLVPQMEESDEFHVLASTEEYDLARFDLQCRVFAKHGRKHELKDYLARYNRLAAKNGWRTIEYSSHAHHMADVGARFLESDKRMTEHFWALPKSFFAEALVAGDDFFLALQMAQEKREAHIRDSNIPNYTRADFRDALVPPSTKPPLRKPTESDQNYPPADSSRESSEKPAEPSGTTEVEEMIDVIEEACTKVGRKGVREALERIAAGELQEPIDVEGEAVEGEQQEPGEPAQRPRASQRTCYDCTRCRAVAEDQRLALVTVDAAGAVDEVLGLMEACPAWYCMPKRKLISVYTQRPERAATIAGECPDFDSQWVRDGDSSADADEEDKEQTLSVGEFMEEPCALGLGYMDSSEGVV